MDAEALPTSTLSVAARSARAVEQAIPANAAVKSRVTCNRFAVNDLAIFHMVSWSPELVVVGSVRHRARI